MYTPKVSVVIPAYNASNYLAEAIDSALAQTYSNLEIVVVNDGSKDDGATERIALSYGDKIRYFSKENGGSSSALNMGIANMSGEWFSWLSHDDLYMPEKLERQIAYMNTLETEPADLPKHIFFAAADLIDATGKTIRKSNLQTEKQRAEKLQAIPHNGYLIAEPTEHIFHGCTCLVHRSVFEKIGCFDETLRLLNDVDFWYRAYAAGYVVHYIPEALVKGRIHGAQVSKSIGYSYHNPEQDMYWRRSLGWLQENHANEHELFFRFGRNAYLKTRNVEGDRAFAHIGTGKVKLAVLKNAYKSRAFVKSLMKKIYLHVKT